jgi:adenylate cyclase
MALEIERKFLVKADSWRGLGPGVLYRQGYLVAAIGKTVRVRVAGEQAFLTIKGGTVGLVRSEYEYAIPVTEAVEMLDTLCESPLVEKYRYKIAIADLVWEVDEFLGENQGLIIAEVELRSADQPISLPDWVGAEVSHEARYFNSNLAKHPFTHWAPAERPDLG